MAQTPDVDDLEQIRADLAALKAGQARQAAADEAKLNMTPSAPKPTQFSSALALAQEHARQARVRAGEEATLEAAAQNARDHSKREAQEKKLAPLDARMRAIFAEQQALELELVDIGRKRVAALADWRPISAQEILAAREVPNRKPSFRLPRAHPARGYKKDQRQAHV
jgi:hypothetical protein